MTTWLASGAISHPWFSHPSSKRKLSAASSVDSSPGRSPSASPSASPPPTKRRKFSALESNFSTLSLANTLSAKLGSSSAFPYVSKPVSASSDDMEEDFPTVVLPAAVKEPDIPEIKMKLSSWYEPEPDRIVVTDLDSSSDEEDNQEDPDKASISISKTLLKHISARSRDMAEPVLPHRGASQALVLFKPMPRPIPEMTATVEEPEEEGHRTIVDTDGIADDAMDIEP
ncbi:hypothetical protein DXG03_003918 [Asterophora parasitica]|uniref:Uncharacterized protein n=1 Tax=Asterophora parasitica TaxID=117018 RepID=A0A9P7KFZ3_9AGAR|nr:hypothetical protein DXG03_003918 [Asterophora parasitica]